MRRRHSSSIRRIQRGYTLLEMAIVATFLALLTVFSVDRISSTVGDQQRANALYEQASQLADGWSVLWQYCAVAPDAVGTLSLGAGGGTAAVNNLALLAGKTTPAAGFEYCFRQSGLQPNNTTLVGAAGSTRMFNHTVTWASATVNGRPHVAVSFTNVKDEVLLPLYRRYSKVSGAASALSIPTATVDTTDPVIRFTAGTTSGRTVTILLQV